MNRTTAMAVEAFRSIERARLKMEAEERALAGVLRNAEVEMDDYYDATEAIARRLGDVEQEADARGWAESTRRQRALQAISSGRN